MLYYRSLSPLANKPTAAALHLEEASGPDYLLTEVGQAPFDVFPGQDPNPLGVCRVREDYLNISIFLSLAQACVVITDWKDDHDHRRRHSSLGYLAPAVYAAGCTCR